MKACPLAVALLLASGCSSGPKVVTPPPASSQALPADLPCPEGFVARTSSVTANPTGAWRVVNQTFEGRNRRVEGAAAFYRDVWPSHGWTLVDSKGDAKTGPATLVFTKKEERARIEIKDESREVVVVVLNVNKKD